MDPPPFESLPLDPPSTPPPGLPEVVIRKDFPKEPPRLRYWTWGLAVFAGIWALVVGAAFPEPLELARQSWPLVLVGLAGALIGNATAIGGGLVFIPVMIFFYGFSPVEALLLALASQAFGMTSGALAWARRGRLPLEALPTILPALLVGCTLATLVIQPSALLVKGLFGPVSILIGLVTLFMVNRHTEGERLAEGGRLPLAGVSLAGGLLTGWVAIGIGEVVAAYLILGRGLKPERSIGLGVVLLSISSVYLTALHTLVLGDIPWETAVFLGLGCVFGARLGPFLTQWVSQRALKIGFAAIAMADGILFLIQYLRSG